MQWFRTKTISNNAIEENRRNLLRGENFGSEAWETPLELADYVVVDMETSGFSPDRDIVLSVAAAWINLSQTPLISNFSYELVSHTDFSQVPDSIWDLTGLSPESLRTGRTWKETLFSLLQFVERRVWIAHHARHELSFIQRYTKDFWKLRVQPIVIDTALVGQALGGTLHPPTLDEVCQWFDIPVVNRHHADDDVRMTALIWKHEAALCKTLGLESVGELLDWTRARVHG